LGSYPLALRITRDSSAASVAVSSDGIGNREIVATTALRQLEALVHRFDAGLTFEVASMSTWSGTLRFALTDPDSDPSRSITFHSAGGTDPEEVAAELLMDARRWLSEVQTQPIPVPRRSEVETQPIPVPRVDDG
jgi:hypothetical protein